MPSAVACQLENASPFHYVDLFFEGWMFVADRDSLHYIDVTGAGRPSPVPLEPGVHVLENAPLDADSGKQQQVRAALADFATWPPGKLVDNLAAVMSSHTDPQACVHAGGYGTRSSTIVLADGSPRVFNTDQRPCEHPHALRDDLWNV